MTPFGGGAAALTAVMGGQVDFTFANGATIMGYVQSGDLRPLAAFTDKRSNAFPDVPAFTEIVSEAGKYLPFGFPYSVLVPAGTDDTVIDQITKYSKMAIGDSSWTEFLSSRPTYKTLYEYEGPEAVNKYWSRFRSVASWLLYDAGVTKYSPEKFNIERVN
jgi:tripartite-type tricarboxylate transporter receptor subunit TctC